MCYCHLLCMIGTIFMLQYLFGKSIQFYDTHIHGVISDVIYRFASGNITQVFTGKHIFNHDINTILQREKCTIFQAGECWKKLDGIKECFAEAVKLEEMIDIEPSFAYNKEISNSFTPLQLIGMATGAFGAGCLLYALWRKSTVPTAIREHPPAQLVVPLPALQIRGANQRLFRLKNGSQ